MPQVIRLPGAAAGASTGDSIGQSLAGLGSAFVSKYPQQQLDLLQAKALEAKRNYDATGALADQYDHFDPSQANARVGNAVRAGVSGQALSGYDLSRASSQPGVTADDPSLGALQLGAGKGFGDTFAGHKLTDDTTRRGQDITANTQVATNAATNLTTQRGQDITADTSRRNNDATVAEQRYQFDQKPTNVLGADGQSSIVPQVQSYGRNAPEDLNKVKGNAARNALTAGGGTIPETLNDNTAVFIGANRPEASPEIVRLQQARDGLPAGDPRRAELDAAIKAKSIGAGGEATYDRTVNDDYAKTDVAIQKDATASNQKLAMLGNMRGMIQGGRVAQGPGSQYTMALQQAGALFGGNPDAASDTEAFRALGNKLTLDAAGGHLGAGLSDGDRKAIAGAQPGMDNTPAGNLKLIDVLQKVENRKQQIAGWLDEYKAGPGRGKVDGGFRSFLQQKAEANPLFTQSSAPAAPPPAPGGATSGPREVAMPPGMPQAPGTVAPGSSRATIQPGVVQDGYQFVGGDPSSPSSWRAVR